MVVCVWFLESIILYIFDKEVCNDLNVYVDFVIDFLSYLKVKLCYYKVFVGFCN